MGIFDRTPTKKGSDKASSEGGGDFDDAPAVTVSLTATPPPAQARPAAPPREEEPPRHSYGIEKAIQLMRMLPVDQNVELVVTVIKTTLESLQMKVSDIISDATRKEKDLEGRVANLKQQISDFEKEIQTRKEEIARLEADHEETSNVKARLELAEKAQQKAAAPAAPPPKPAVAKPSVPMAATVAQTSGGKA
jgi:hypothetical protein